MNCGLLHEEDVAEFERRWPDAAVFLLHRELVNERSMLLREQSFGCYGARQSRVAWVTKRLQELAFLDSTEPAYERDRYHPRTQNARTEDDIRLARK